MAELWLNPAERERAGRMGFWKDRGPLLHEATMSQTEMGNDAARAGYKHGNDQSYCHTHCQRESNVGQFNRG